MLLLLRYGYFLSDVCLHDAWGVLMRAQSANCSAAKNKHKNTHILFVRLLVSAATVEDINMTVDTLMVHMTIICEYQYERDLVV